MYVLVPDVLAVADSDRVEAVPICTAVPKPLDIPATMVLLPPDHAAENPVPPFWPARFELIGYWKVSVKSKPALEVLAPHTRVAQASVNTHPNVVGKCRVRLF